MRSINIAGPSGNLHILEESAPDTATNRLPIVFLHGMAFNAGLWKPQLARCGSSRRAFALDLRGHGSSELHSAQECTPASCASDVLTVLDALELSQIALVGHSFGACAALATAAAAPHRIAQLVLVDPPGDFTKLPPQARETELVPFLAALETEGWREVVESGFSDAAGSVQATRDRVMGNLASSPQSLLLGMYRSMFAFEAIDALDRYLAAPLARAEAILAPANAWPFSLHILQPALSAIVLPDTAHWLMLDAPELFDSALDTCLAEV